MQSKNEIDKENALAILSLFWSFAKKHPRDLTLSFIFIPLNVVLLFTAIPWLVSQIVQQLANQGAGQNLLPYILGIVLCSVLGLVCNFIGYAANFRHQTDVYGDIVRTCFNTLTHRGEQFYANQFTGALTKYSIDFPGAYSTIEITAINNILPLLVRSLSGVIVVMLAGAPLLGLILLVMVTVTISLMYRTRRARQSIRVPRRNASTAISGHMADIITNNQTMRTFAWWDGEEKTNEKLVSKWSKLMNADFELLNRHFNRVLQTNFLIQLVFILVLILLVNNGAVSIAVAIFSVNYLTRFATEILGIGGIINQTENALIDAAPMMSILQEEAEVVDDKNAAGLKITKGKVSFESVDFAYNENIGQTVLPNFTIVIEAGEKIGLVGPSGGGKTTITKLLLRLLDIQNGAITIDGQNIASVTQESLRRNISYVPQDPLLFHRSLAENISYAKPGASKSDILSAAKKAHAHEFISQLPDGYDTLVGERGVKLSGGQRQRVAIARAMLKNAPILVLDEATSALDSESEKLIQDALAKLMEGRTTIVIAHRLSTIQKMDRIIVLDEGKIAEEGTHRELLQNKGLYAKLWAHQSGGFLED